MEEFFEFESCTGEKVSARKWIDKDFKEYKGVIELVHGMQEHIGRYSEFAEFLASNGFIVVGHDHLGHGRTPKLKRDFGYFASKDGWDKLVEDIHLLQNIVHNEYPNLPYIIFGHSMGSLIVRTYITKYDDALDGIIISGTSGQKLMLNLGMFLIKIIEIFKGKRYRSKLITKLVTGSFNKNFKPNRTPSDWLCSDEQVVDRFLEDKLCGIPFTLQAYYDLLSGTKYLSKQKNIDETPIDVPILIFSGENDPVGENGKGVLRVYNMLKKDEDRKVYLRLFENGRHEMLNEVNKLEVHNFVLDWIDKNVLKKELG